MPAPSLSWNLCRVFGTWRNLDGTMKAGSYTVTIPARVTDATDDTIIPAGTFKSGTLQTQSDSIPSLDIMVPCTDDPDIQQTGWHVQIVVTFDDKSTSEAYALDVPYADRPTSDGGTGDGVDLRTIALPANLPVTQALYKIGVPGGLAQLNSDGDVIDAAGDPVTGGGGGGGGGPITADDITDATTVGKAVVRAASQDALMGLLEAASPTGAGIVELASNTDATTGTDTTKALTPAAGKAAITAAVAALVNSAPGALDTLGEIATQLASDESGAAALVTTVGGKLAKSANLSDVASAATSLSNLGGVPTTRTVAGHALSGNVTLVKGDVGLGNVDNTSDVNKPISTLTQEALDLKVETLDYSNAAPGSRYTLLYNGSTGFVDPATGSVAAARPSATTDIYFDLIGGSSSVTDPAWMLNGDAREITS